MNKKNLFKYFVAPLLSLVIVSFFSGLVAAQELDKMPAGEYQIDPTHTSVVWKVSHFGFSDYVGRFNQIDGTLSLAPDDFSKSEVSVSIATDSLDTDYPNADEKDFNAELASNWMKSGDHPDISFKSTGVSALDGNKFTIDGELTFVGKTFPVTLDATLNASTPKHFFFKVPVIGFSATTTIDRTAFGVDKYAPGIGAEVKIEIQTEFQQKES